MEVEIGQKVHYHPVITQGCDGKTYTVRDVSELASGQRVAFLEGKSGCVSLDALSECKAAE